MRHVLLWIGALVGVAVFGLDPGCCATCCSRLSGLRDRRNDAPGPTIPNGGTSNITGLTFYAGMAIDHNGGGEEATARVRLSLPDGLHWGPDVPDPSEKCVGTATTAECDTPVLLNSEPSRRTVGWVWDVVADKPGSYMLRVETVSTSATDPDLSSNTASVTVVVSEASGGGSGGGGGGAATVSAGAAKVVPAKPKAGSLVTASVRVTAGGAPIRPTAVACGATLAGTKVIGTPRAATGGASCRYRTSKAAKGKTLRGSVSFSARGKRFTKRFSVRLG